MMNDQEKLLNQVEAILNESLKLRNKVNHLTSLNRKIIILSEEKQKMENSLSRKLSEIQRKSDELDKLITTSSTSSLEIISQKLVDRLDLCSGKIKESQSLLQDYYS